MPPLSRIGRAAVVSLVLLAPAAPLAAAEFGVGAGLVGSGLGFEVHFRPEHSPWRVGFEYGRQPAHVDHDPFTGRALTRESESLSGLFVHYQFHPDGPRGWYLGASVLRWSRSETSLVRGDTSTTSTTDPYFGFGYRVRGKHVFFNAALFISSSAENETRTATSSTENKGNFDAQLAVGGTF